MTPSAAWTKKKSAWSNKRKNVSSAKKSSVKLRLSLLCNSMKKTLLASYKNSRNKKPFASLRRQSASASSKKLYARPKKMSSFARWRSWSDSARRNSSRGRDWRMKRTRGRRERSA